MDWTGPELTIDLAARRRSLFRNPQRAPRTIALWLDAHPAETLLFVAHGGIFDGLHAHTLGPRTGPESKHATPYLFTPGPAGWSIAEVA